MPLEAGSQFGRFRIVRQLGAGAMGEVYLAEDPHIERLLAIKTVRVLEHGAEVEKGLRERLAREAKAAGRLVHPNVVTLFEAGEIEGAFYLAFEYVEGSDLAVRMRQQPPLGLDEALRIVREAASGLAAAHRRGIVHRDVKPSNLLLDADGVVKVTDFGIAKLVGQGTAYTASGAIVGTPQYLSPEQVRSEKLDGRSDLFSLGAVLYELLAQRRPFDGDTITSLMYQILHQEPPAVADLRPQVPARLAAAVSRLLAKDPEQRFPSGEALVEELAAIERERAAMRERPTVTLPERIGPAPLPAAEGDFAPPVSENSRSSEGRQSRWLVVLVAAVLLIAAGAVLVGALLLPWIRGLRGVDDADPSTIAANERAASEESARQPQGNEAPNERQASAPPDRREEPAGTPPPLLPRDATSGAGPSRTEAVTPSEEAVASRRVVGTALTFVISPPEAARSAQVTIDGIPRGPAASSLMTLRPGPHRVVVVATGFEPLPVEVQARPGLDAPTRLELTMRRAGAASGTP